MPRNASASKPDDTERKLTDAIAWLEARRRDEEAELAGLMAALRYYSSPSPDFDRYRYGECHTRIQLFGTVIAQHKARLRTYQIDKREQQRLAKRERERLAYVHEEEADVEPLLYALARPDVLDVKAVEAMPTYADHRLTTQLSRQAASLEAWHYQCLGSRTRRPSRRYEGFRPLK